MLFLKRQEMDDLNKLDLVNYSEREDREKDLEDSSDSDSVFSEYLSKDQLEAAQELKAFKSIVTVDQTDLEYSDAKRLSASIELSRLAERNVLAAQKLSLPTTSIYKAAGSSSLGFKARLLEYREEHVPLKIRRTDRYHLFLSNLLKETDQYKDLSLDNMGKDSKTRSNKDTQQPQKSQDKPLTLTEKNKLKKAKKEAERLARERELREEEERSEIACSKIGSPKKSVGLTTFGDTNRADSSDDLSLVGHMRGLDITSGLKDVVIEHDQLESTKTHADKLLDAFEQGAEETSDQVTQNQKAPKFFKNLLSKVGNSDKKPVGETGKTPSDDAFPSKTRLSLNDQVISLIDILMVKDLKEAVSDSNIVRIPNELLEIDPRIVCVYTSFFERTSREKHLAEVKQTYDSWSSDLRSLSKKLDDKVEKFTRQRLHDTEYDGIVKVIEDVSDAVAQLGSVLTKKINQISADLPSIQTTKSVPKKRKSSSSESSESGKDDPSGEEDDLSSDTDSDEDQSLVRYSLTEWNKLPASLKIKFVNRRPLDLSKNKKPQVVSRDDAPKFSSHSKETGEERRRRVLGQVHAEPVDLPDQSVTKKLNQCVEDAEKRRKQALLDFSEQPLPISEISRYAHLVEEIPESVLSTLGDWFEKCLAQDLPTREIVRGWKKVLEKASEGERYKSLLNTLRVLQDKTSIQLALYLLESLSGKSFMDPEVKNEFAMTYKR